MSNRDVIHDLVDSFFSEVSNRARQNDPVFQQLEDDLAGRDNRWDTNRARAMTGTLASLWDFYLNARYPREQERDVFGYVISDSLDFAWAETLRRYETLPATEADIRDMEKLLRDAEELTLDVTDWKRQNERSSRGWGSAQPNYNQANYNRGGYGGQQNSHAGDRWSHTAYGRGRSHQQGSFSGGYGNEANSQWQDKRAPRETQPQQPRQPVETHKSFSAYGSGTSARQWHDTTDAQDVSTSRVQDRFNQNQPERPTNAHGYNELKQVPELLYERDSLRIDPRTGKWVILTMEEAMRWQAAPNEIAQNGFLVASPFTERLFIWLDENYQKRQKVVKVTEMDIEDHKWVIQPKYKPTAEQVRFERPRLVYRNSEDSVDVRSSSEVYRIANEILAEDVKAGLVPKNIQNISQFGDPIKAGEYAHRANLRIIADMEEKAKAKLAEELKVKQEASPNKSASVFTLLEHDASRENVQDQIENKEQEVEIQVQTESLKVASVAQLMDRPLTGNWKEGRGDALVQPFEAMNALYRTANTEEFKVLRDALAPLKRNKDNSLAHVFSTLVNELALNDPNLADLKRLLDRQITDIINWTGKVYLNLDVTMESFISDYPELSRHIKGRMDNNFISEGMFTAWNETTTKLVCSLFFPTVEGYKVFQPNMSEEDINATLSRTLFTYHFGHYVYLPYSSETLGFNHRANSYIQVDSDHELAEILQNVKREGLTYVATRDSALFLVAYDKEQRSYIVTKRPFF